MKFFKKYPSLIGLGAGLIIVIIFVCTTNNACWREHNIEENGVDTVQTKSAIFSVLLEAFKKGITIPFVIMYHDSSIPFFIRLWYAIRSFCVLYNPWFVIPVCIVLSNVIFTQLEKKYKKLAWINR